MSNDQSSDGLGWLIAIGLGCYIAYTHWWKTPEPAIPPAPIVSTGVSSGPVATLSNGTVWRMVWDSIKGPRTARLAWVREDHSKNKTLKARETLSLFKIDCTTSGYVTLSVIDYDKDGKVIENRSDFSKEETYAPPFTYIDNVVKAACRPQFDKPS